MQEINTIYVNNIRIDEPVVSLTDLILSILCFYFFYRIHQSRNNHRTFYLFKYYFFIMGFAMAFGGLTGHAFLYALSPSWKLLGWIISMLSIMLVERAAIEHTRILIPKHIIRMLLILNILEFLTFLSLTIISLNFFFVEFHSGYGLMFVVASLEGYLFLKTRDKGSRLILIGVLFAGIAAFIFMNKISPYQWFNYLSFSHVFMAISLTLFFTGIMKIDMSNEYEINYVPFSR